MVSLQGGPLVCVYYHDGSVQYGPRKYHRCSDFIHLDTAKGKHYNTYELHQYSFLFHDNDEDESAISEILVGIKSNQFCCLELLQQVNFRADCYNANIAHLALLHIVLWLALLWAKGFHRN